MPSAISEMPISLCPPICKLFEYKSFTLPLSVTGLYRTHLLSDTSFDSFLLKLL